MNLYIIPKHGTVPLAGNNQRAKIIGEVVINIEINGKTHHGIVCEVIEDLCVDFIIGRDRMQKHRRVVFNFNGPEDDLIIGALPEHSENQSSNSLDVSPPGNDHSPARSSANSSDKFSP